VYFHYFDCFLSNYYIFCYRSKVEKAQTRFLCNVFQSKFFVTLAFPLNNKLFMEKKIVHIQKLFVFGS
jgi:hypothetical protein